MEIKLHAFYASFYLILRHRKHLYLKTVLRKQAGEPHARTYFIMHGSQCTDHYYRLNYQLNWRTIAGGVQII